MLIKSKVVYLSFVVLCYFIVANPLSAQIMAGAKYRYIIESLHSNMALDVPAGSAQPNTGMIQWYSTGSQNQQWYFTDAGNGLYRIHSANSYLVLDVRDGSYADSVTIIQNYASLDSSQRFAILDLGADGYVIKASHSDKAFDIKNASLSALAEVIQTPYVGNASQRWRIKLKDSIPEAHSLFNPGICTGIGNQYRIHAKSDVHLIWDTYWASTQAGANVDLYGGQGGTHQRCYFEAVGNQQYVIYMMHNGMAVQPKNGSTSEGAGIELMPRNGSTAQQFTFNYLGDGNYAIINQNSGLALTKSGQDIIQAAFSGSIDQQWVLIMTEGNCNGVSTGITDIQRYYTKTPENTCNTVRMFYVVPIDAPQRDRQALCAAAALSQQRTWADYDYTVAFEPIVVVNSTHDMNWFMVNGDSAWYSYAQNAEIEVMVNYPIDYNNEKLLVFVEGVCSAAAGGWGSAGVPGCMIDGMAVGEPNNYGVVGHELGHHMFGTGHPEACEKIFPQDNMCNNVYPASIIYRGSYTDNHIDGNDGKWIKEKSNCTAGLKTCDLPTPMAAYQSGNGEWVEVGSPAVVGVELGRPLSLSMAPHNLSYYRWYGPQGLIKRGNTTGDILVSDNLAVAELGTYRCVGMNDEGCSIHIDITLTDTIFTGASEVSIRPFFQIRPNPATEKVMIAFDNKVDPTRILLFNQLGQALWVADYEDDVASIVEINIANLRSGLYYIAVENNNGERALQKFLKL